MGPKTLTQSINQSQAACDAANVHFGPTIRGTDILKYDVRSV